MIAINKLIVYPTSQLNGSRSDMPNPSWNCFIVINQINGINILK